jgi:ribosomal protein L40E
MSTVVGIILVFFTLAYILYPFFRRKQIQIEKREIKIAPESMLETEDDIEINILKLRKQKGIICPRCGTINQIDARYCRQCAAVLSKRK